MLRHATATRHKPSFDGRWIQLLDAAARVFSAEGYEGASMRRLAREADISQAGIYHYVSGKGELLYWIQFNTFDSLLRGLERSLVGVVDPRDRLHAAVLNHVRHFGAHMHELKVCARELDALEGEAYQAVRDRRRAYFDAVHALVMDVTPKPDAPLDAWLATANLFGTMNWFYQWYDPERHPVNLDQLAAQQTALFLDGYAAARDDDDDRSDP
ncbi:MAG: TetR/AcrR family transcriptional regulator [Planctomycetota bacterium]|jgi:AcrR family transcriptional regulator